MIDLLEHGMLTGETVNVNIVDLINGLDGSVDTGTEEWFARAVASKILDVECGYLLESILDNGLTCPLNVVSYGYGFEMGNGHHRLILALLAGIEHLDVYVTNDIDFVLSEDHEDIYDNVSYTGAYYEDFRDIYHTANLVVELALDTTG